MSIERITFFKPASDRRKLEPPYKDGPGGANLYMVVKGDHGAIEFEVFTKWHLPQVQKELVEMVEGKITISKGDIRCYFLPAPADLCYHAKKPQKPGQQIFDTDCKYTGGDCYYDGSGLEAEELFEMLTSQGSDAVWEELESRYLKQFGELK
jgi:hypothetical protein